MHKAVSPETTLTEVYSKCTTAGWGCVDCKKVMFDNFDRELVPLRVRRQELLAKPEEVHTALADGAAKARVLAESTMVEVRATRWELGGAHSKVREPWFAAVALVACVACVSGVLDRVLPPRSERDPRGSSARVARAHGRLDGRPGRGEGGLCAPGPAGTTEPRSPGGACQPSRGASRAGVRDAGGRPVRSEVPPEGDARRDRGGRRHGRRDR